MRHIVILLLALSSLPLWGQKPTVKIPRVPRPPLLEDFLGMKPPADLAGMAKIENLIQRDPKDGEPATERTEIYIGWDDKNFYAVFVCFDKHPELIRARMGRRESIDGDDSVWIFLDPFQDHQRAYEFAVNAFGIQMDGITTETQGDDFSWDTLWDSSGKLTSTGYVVRMALPFRSLRFPRRDVQTWGMGFLRIIARNGEASFWPRVTHRVEGFAQQLATGEGMSGISPGRNMQFIPYAAFGTSRFLDTRNPIPDFRKQWDKRVGLDAKFVIKDAFTLDVAINPDFSQVESDDPQVTVNQRFEVFFPEKRPFFIENSSYFQTPLNLFFSRRIGDPEFGARITGKKDGWAVGALVIDDRAPGEAVPDGDPNQDKRARFEVLRVNREFNNQSTIGAIYTERDFGGGFNRVGGVDFRWKIDKNWVASGQALASSTRNLDGTYQAGPAYTAGLNRSGRSLNIFMNYEDESPGFVTQTGFVPRVDIRQMTTGLNYNYYPKKSKFLVSMSANVNIQGIWDHSGLRLERNNYNTIAWNFKRNNFFGINHNQFHERLRPGDYPTLFAPHDYPHHATGFFGGTDAFKKVSLFADVRWATRINYDAPTGTAPYLANVLAISPNLTIRPFDRLRVDNTYLLTRFNDRAAGASIYNNHILQSKWNWQFNREFSLRAIMQYNAVLSNPMYTSLARTKNANADILLTWLLHPGTAAYLGYNSNFQNLDPTGQYYTPRSFINDGRTVFVKLSWLFRY